MGEGISLAEIKREEALQLSLLPECDLEALARVWEPKPKHPVHTGAYVTRDEELCDRIALRVLEGQSDRKIAREVGVATRSIRRVMQVLEERGMLAALKQRLSAKLGKAAEMAADRSIEALERDEVPANVLPIMLGVFVDKKALLDGEATVRIEAREVIDVGASFEALKALVAGAPVRALEAGSSGKVAIGGVSEGVIDVDTVRDTELARGERDLGAVPEGAGGGSAILTACGQGDGLGGENLISKGGSS